jgi:hypothetical protein
LSPERAETSTETGMFDEDAHFEASSVLTSLPSGAIVALSCDPRPMPLFELTELPASKGKAELLLLTLDDVAGGMDASIKDGVPFARSCLLPTNRSVKFGDARARASFRKVGREVKVECEVIS